MEYLLLVPEPQTAPKYFLGCQMSVKYEEQNQFHHYESTPLWNVAPWERDPDGLWSALLDHNLTSQTEELAEGSWCSSWPSPRRACVESGYPKQGLQPGEDSLGGTTGQGRHGHSRAAGSTLYACSPGRKAPRQHRLDFVPCKHFTWLLPMSDALAGHGLLWHLFTNAALIYQPLFHCS